MPTPTTVSPVETGVQVARYCVIVPAFAAPAWNATLSAPFSPCVVPGMTASTVGAPGSSTITAFDAADDGLVPTVFVAVTLQV